MLFTASYLAVSLLESKLGLETVTIGRHRKTTICTSIVYGLTSWTDQIFNISQYFEYGKTLEEVRLEKNMPRIITVLDASLASTQWAAWNVDQPRIDTTRVSALRQPKQDRQHAKRSRPRRRNDVRLLLARLERASKAPPGTLWREGTRKCHVAQEYMAVWHPFTLELLQASVFNISEIQPTI